jgi:hypothetical protein
MSSEIPNINAILVGLTPGSCGCSSCGCFADQAATRTAINATCFDTFTCSVTPVPGSYPTNTDPCPSIGCVLSTYDPKANLCVKNTIRRQCSSSSFALPATEPLIIVAETISAPHSFMSSRPLPRRPHLGHIAPTGGRVEWVSILVT